MESWTCRHFSQSNALDDRPDDLPHLLRRIADSIESIGVTPMQLMDVVVSQEMREFGPWWSVAVYWSPSDAHD